MKTLLVIAALASPALAGPGRSVADELAREAMSRLGAWDVQPPVPELVYTGMLAPDYTNATHATTLRELMVWATEHTGMSYIILKQAQFGRAIAHVEIDREIDVMLPIELSRIEARNVLTAVLSTVQLQVRHMGGNVARISSISSKTARRVSP